MLNANSLWIPSAVACCLAVSQAVAAVTPTESPAKSLPTHQPVFNSPQHSPQSSIQGSTAQSAKQPPLVIAHRGASGYAPEHSLRAYELALAQGADVVELDLVVSRDQQLLVRHENELSHSTNVAQLPQFASRKTKKRVDGLWQEGWFAEDFTLAELTQLKLRETKPQQRPANLLLNDQYHLLSLADVLAWNKAQWQQGRRYALYMELKHPSFFAEQAAPFHADSADLLVRQLASQPLPPGQALYIESFEPTALKQLAKRRRDLPTPTYLVQLIGDTSGASTLPKDNFSYAWDQVLASKLALTSAALPTYAQMVTANGLAEVAQYADAIGPWRDNLYPYARGPVAPWVVTAKQLGLQIHPYTFRQEGPFLQKTPQAQPISMCEELTWLLQQPWIDGVFADQPDIAVAARAGRCDNVAAATTDAKLNAN